MSADTAAKRPPASPDPGDGAALAEALLGGDRAAVPRALNLIDDQRPAQRRVAHELLARIEDVAQSMRSDGAGHRIGITGAPGAGKSTLLDALVRELRGRGQSVGILAVDPSSQRTGGALLGDRFRLRSGTRDGGVFVRSMAARDRLGGLADATYASALVLGAVFDRVFVETVGVGQSEGDVASLVDTLLFVAQPGAGDLLQFMKAGILELPDVFAVNKADMGPDAERTAGELEAGLGLGSLEASSDWRRPVLAVSARTGLGISDLVDSFERHRVSTDASGALDARRRSGRERFALDALRSRYGSYGLAALGGPEAVTRSIRETANVSIFAQLETLGGRIESALRKTPDAQ